MQLWLVILLIAVLLCLLGGLAAMLCITFPISKRVYKEQLVRTDAEKWGRVCSAPENDEQIRMWNEGVMWAEENKQSAEEVHIKNGDFNLYGEYYNFGGDKCAVILPGRCECLMYSYYFAKPYQDAGMNVLVIDSRCHGKSDGTYSTIGVCESVDLIEWMKYIQREKNISGFWLHGICIGSAGALFAAVSDEGASKIDGIVLEGCFVNFRETFKQHMIEMKKPVFPVLDLVMYNIYRHTGVNVIAKSPIKVIDKIKCPILFLFGKKDVFSLPPKSQKLFDKCGSSDKKLVWFDEGGHSHLRINNTEKYDNAIKEFVGVYGNKQ